MAHHELTTAARRPQRKHREISWFIDFLCVSSVFSGALWLILFPARVIAEAHHGRDARLFLEKQQNGADPSVLIDPALPAYVPQPVAFPKDASYVLRDGSISIIGYNDMDGILANLNSLFAQSHLGFNFTMQLKGTATAAPALTYGTSAFAPMGAEFSPFEMTAYRLIVGEDPLAFRVAHCAVDPRARSAPIGIYVNRANPLERLTVEQIGRVFTTGSTGGDITRWGQLGLKGEWADRAIHVYGIAEEAAAGLAPSMLSRFGDRPFTPAYESFLQSTEVVKRVGEDTGGIGFASGNVSTSQAKLVAVAENEGRYYSHLTAADVIAGKYPLDRYLLIYVRQRAGAPVDPVVREYLRLVFSKEGQRAIAAAAPGYLPLNAREAAAESAKLK